MIEHDLIETPARENDSLPNRPVYTSLLGLVRESGGEFGISVGRDENDNIVDVQVAAVGDSAKDVVRVLEELEKTWERDQIV